ncbi:MAG: radical SAM protein [Candidatus Omnitrophica bacterium]|nr:radical SAM protein [Candidatus Omnitrophota bacterium]MBU1912455.1 radical SAM protein [Candidatus Omnitrophota bacterium]
MANLGICNKCGKSVPIKHYQKEGKEYLEKLCPDCGAAPSLISNDTRQYNRKREFMADRHYPGCHMDCLSCTHRDPNIIFIETTNRCNMNCPICITNVPSMGFQFEPRMEFFDRIFSHYAKFERPPSVQLFGGEPTMREDLLDIIKLAKSYGLSVRLVTNGLKLADKKYAEKIMASGAAILIAFDGLKREMYQKLRNFPESLDIKLKALDNLAHHRRRKVVLMTVVDKNINGDDMPKFLAYCLKNRHIRGIFLMPLTQVWSDQRLQYKPERTTQEDVENIVKNAVGGKAEFVPLGSWEFHNIAKVLKQTLMPFTGVHPNCESFTYLIPQGNKYVSISDYLKFGLFSLVADLREMDKKIEPYTLKDPISKWHKFRVHFVLARLLFKHIDLAAVIGKRGFSAFIGWMSFFGKLLIGRNFLGVLSKETTLTDIRGALQILLLPFEDDDILESARLEKCASCFAYIDLKSDTVKSIPFCIWEKYKQPIMKDIAKEYNKEGYTQGLPDKKIACL